MIDGFNEKWPDIQVDVFRSGTEEVVSKVLAEKEAGSVLADVLLVADDVTFETLKEQDLLMAYESPELEGIPETYIDKDHMYTGTKVITTGIVYNTELTDTVPTSFADLTNEAYKDDLIMPSPLYSGAAAYNLGVLTRTEGLGWDYYQALKDNGITVGQGNGSVQNAVVAGEKACGLLADYMAIRSKNDGAPVEFVYPCRRLSRRYRAHRNCKRNGQRGSGQGICRLRPLGRGTGPDRGNRLHSLLRAALRFPKDLRALTNSPLLSWDTEELYQNREADKEQFSEMFQ